MNRNINLRRPGEFKCTGTSCDILARKYTVARGRPIAFYGVASFRIKMPVLELPVQTVGYLQRILYTPRKAWTALHMICRQGLNFPHVSLGYLRRRGEEKSVHSTRVASSSLLSIRSFSSTIYNYEAVSFSDAARKVISFLLFRRKKFSRVLVELFYLHGVFKYLPITSKKTVLIEEI